jgi:hypothetical protein
MSNVRFASSWALFCITAFSLSSCSDGEQTTQNATAQSVTAISVIDQHGDDIAQCFKSVHRTQALAESRSVEMDQIKGKYAPMMMIPGDYRRQMGATTAMQYERSRISESYSKDLQAAINKVTRSCRIAQTAVQAMSNATDLNTSDKLSLKRCVEPIYSIATNSRAEDFETLPDEWLSCQNVVQQVARSRGKKLVSAETVERNQEEARVARSEQEFAEAQNTRKIPLQYLGTYDENEERCTTDDSDMKLTIKLDAMEFYESKGAVAGVTDAAEGAVVVNLRNEGEGEVWYDKKTVRLSDGKLFVDDVGRVRCNLP